MARGQKTCPKCNNTTGPRTKVCPACQHSFEFKEKKLVTKTNASECLAPEVKSKTPIRYGENFIYAGKCPLPLKGNNYGPWLEKIRALRSNGLRYSRKAIIGFVLDNKEAVEFVKNNMEEYPSAIAYEELIKQHIYKIYTTPRKRYI